MKFLTVLQVRFSSSRLPGKALFDFYGVPMSVLSAVRAKNDFSNLYIATSDDRSDNHLAQVFENYGFEVYRGSLDNVLSRFIEIASLNNLTNGDCIIRLTGDNLLVDSSLLMELKEFYIGKKLEYFSSQPDPIENFNWPKGLSAEFINVGALRESYKADLSKENIEHVTTFIRKKTTHKYSGIDCIDLKNNFKGLSFSIDTLEEFHFMKKQFEGCSLKDNYKIILKES